MRPSRFENKIVIVTGAAQGIGRAVAESMAAEGAILALIDLSPIVEETVEACLKAASPNCIFRLANLEASRIGILEDWRIGELRGSDVWRG